MSITHSSLANTASDREIHLPGYSVANHSALLLVGGMVAGDHAYKQDDGTEWIYDGTITAWRICDRFITTSVNLSALTGVHQGDRVFLTDTNQVGFYVGPSSYDGVTWVYLS